MIKNTKRVFALILAVAVVAMSMFTGFVVSATEPVQTAEGTIDLLEFGEYLTEAGSTSKYYDSVLADNGETGDSWENAIIIDNAEEFVYLCKASGNDTAGKYYKVADGIAGFNLANNDLDINGTLADNLDVIMSAGKNHAGATPGFQGHFDGNGATVYGAWSNHNAVSNYAGLFTATYGEVTIKNIHVNKAHFTAKNAVGGIVGLHDAADMCTVTIENCSITDSYLETQGTGYGHGVGAILGFGKSAPSWKEADKGVDGNGDGDMADTIYVNVAYNIKNCYVNLDEANFVSKAEDGVEDSGERVCHGGVAGVLGSNALMVSDSVVIGIKPYATMEGTSANDVQHSGLESHFANVYTTENVAIAGVNLGGNGALAAREFTGKIFPLSDAQLKGAAAVENMNLDWSVWMADADGYPELANAHKNVTTVDNGNGTHADTCACGFGGIAVPHTWVDEKCACGAELNCAGRTTIYWNGDIATGIATGTGTKDDPYVIKAAAEFAWLIQNGKPDVTAGKYYKIADDIGAIVLQPEAYGEAIKGLADAAAVKAYFEANKDNMKTWPTMGWEAVSFAGNFDGNGVTVYGLYQESTNNAGLFSTIDAGAAIKNIALKNSYLTSTAGDYQVGGIAAVTSSVNYGVKANGAIWIDSCVVANNYMYNSSTSHDRTGVIIGSSTDMLYIDNCLVYGNDATYGDSVVASVWSSGQNSQIVSEDTIAPEGLELVNDDAETPRYYNKLRNSVIFGAKPYDLAQTIGSRFNDPRCFENVLTDADVANDVFSNGATMNVSEEQIKVVALADLATAELGDAWINTESYPELVSFHDAEFTAIANNDGTHSIGCSCGLAAVENCKYVDNKCPVCGSELNCATKKTIYWDGSVATGFVSTAAGTKDDPIIINTASELAYLISSKADVSTLADGTQKYFKIADEIGTIVLQPASKAADILALADATAVKAYFESATDLVEWPEKSWEGSCFAGNFDGNGAKIYGLYIESDSNAGLFSTVDAGAAIRNIAVLNSYIYSHSTSANYQVGAIAAVASNNGYGADAQGVIWFDGCIVANNYMRNDASDIARSGVIIGAASSDAVAIDNCLVYGNDAFHGADHATKMSLISIVSNSVIAPGRVPAELDAKIHEKANADGDSMYYNSVRNTISLGTDIMNTTTTYGYRKNDPACYENNYTDAASGTVEFADGNTWTYEDAQIKAVTAEDLNGASIGDAWIANAGMPELRAFHMFKVVDNGDGTHSESCACDLEGLAVDHVAGEVVRENVVDATCKDDGSYDAVVYCEVCDALISKENTVIPATGEHVYDDNADTDCNVCGEVRELPTFTYGDINDDGAVNNKDLGLLMQYINNWNVTVNVDASDVNADGAINNKDYGLLMQFINNWEVVLGPQG